MASMNSLISALAWMVVKLFCRRTSVFTVVAKNDLSYSVILSHSPNLVCLRVTGERLAGVLASAISMENSVFSLRSLGVVPLPVSG